jgi:sugar phosphate isomerase/epimerase
MVFTPQVLIIAILCAVGLIASEIFTAIRADRERKSRDRFKDELASLGTEADDLQRQLDTLEPEAEARDKAAQALRDRIESAREKLRRLELSRVIYVYELGTPDSTKDVYVSNLRLVQRREDGPLAELIRSPLWDYQNMAEIWARDPEEAQRQVNLVFPSDSGISPTQVRATEGAAR